MDFDRIRRRMDEGEVIPEYEVTQIVEKLIELLYTEDNLLVLRSPIIICGDIHGQYEDLCELFNRSGGVKNPANRYLFMGDYVDRGKYSLNTFLYLASLKLQFPDRFFLLRGNHETRNVSASYGFHTECLSNYGHTGVWSLCMTAFDLLPLAALVDNDVFCVHGGLSPEMPLIELLLTRDRQKELPDAGMLADLTWSDPSEDINGWRANSRGAGFLFGKDVVINFCRLNRLRLVTRSHQLVMDGFKYYFGDGEHVPEGRLINVWSAPNYGYTSGNDASFMKLRFDGIEEYHLEVFKEREARIEGYEMKPSDYFA